MVYSFSLPDMRSRLNQNICRTSHDYRNKNKLWKEQINILQKQVIALQDEIIKKQFEISGLSSQIDKLNNTYAHDLFNTQIQKHRLCKEIINNAPRVNRPLVNQEVFERYIETSTIMVPTVAHTSTISKSLLIDDVDIITHQELCKNTEIE